MMDHAIQKILLLNLSIKCVGNKLLTQHIFSFNF